MRKISARGSALALMALVSSAPFTARAAEAVVGIDPVVPQYQAPVVAVVEAPAATTRQQDVKHGRYYLDLSLDLGNNNYWDSGNFKGPGAAQQAFQLEFQPHAGMIVADHLVLGVNAFVGMETKALDKSTDLTAGAGLTGGVRFYPSAHTTIQPTLDVSYLYRYSKNDSFKNHGMRMTARLDFMARIANGTHIAVGPFLKQNVITKNDESRSVSYGIGTGLVMNY